jgi:hypothetical protein
MDGIKNGIKTGTTTDLESDVDCGGTRCTPCDPGLKCLQPTDCKSLICTTTCQAPKCTDTVKNGDETDVDCGGSCGATCTEGKACKIAGDCKDKVCDPTSHVCQKATCTDGVKNGTETDVDCGGSCATKCGVNQGCGNGGDCSSKSCPTTPTPRVCAAASCSDKIVNQDETGVDCGGTMSMCSACPDGQGCGTTNAFCVSGFCNPTSHVCAEVGCGDGFKNGSETDVDCGGSCDTSGATCKAGQKCNVPADCKDGVCATTCQAPTCSDKAQNQSESDIDCGGPNCSACADGKKCGKNSDCVNLSCPAGACLAPTCGDASKNGAETDLNCGGPTCPACAVGKICSAPRDCDSTLCSTTCQAKQFWLEYAQENGTTSDLEFDLWIHNGTGTSHTLSEFKWRYFYTTENPAPDAELTDCFFIQAGSAGSSCTLLTYVHGALPDGSTYMEFGASSAAWLLPAMGDSGGIHTRIHKSTWTPYTQTDDYSYDPSKPPHMAPADPGTIWSHVVLYQVQGANLVRVWGIEP